MGAEDLHHCYDDSPRGEVTGEDLMLRNSKTETLMTVALDYSVFIKINGQCTINQCIDTVRASSVVVLYSYIYIYNIMIYIYIIMH